MNPDSRWIRLIIVLVVLMGLLMGRSLFRRKPITVSSPADYTEQIEDLNGTRTR